ncbi:hypothetical protein RDWZM_001761 [Blomia tropicalis]|uniref:Uncharacterized protein n=1 Tax=Blomia tropicalis TaxID=40697 RepID=A0A9Q0MC99_BLOTA|nr:hypothetical protein RDWZM_001761 [Blomia tropicalis]
MFATRLTSLSSQSSLSLMSQLMSTYPPSFKVNCHLVAALYPDEIFHSSINHQTYVCSTKSELLVLILKYLRCSLRFIVSKHNFGGGLINGTWTGIVETLASNEADFIAHKFSNVKHRDQIIEFNNMQPFKELLTIFYYPKIYVDNNPWKMFNFLSIRLWLLIFCSYIAFALINRANRKSFGLFHLFANLMGQQTVQTSLVWRKFEWNPIIIWLFATFIIRELYSSDITAAILSANQFHFDTFEKLHHAGSDLQILIENQSSTFHYMNLRFPSLVSMQTLVKFEDLGTVRLLNQIIETKSVLICSREHSEKFKSYYSTVKFAISREGFDYTFGSYAVRKTLNIRYRNLLNRLFRQLNYFGLSDKLSQTTLINNIRTILRSNTTDSELVSTLYKKQLKIPYDESVDSTKPIMNVNDFITCIYLWLIGIVLSCFSLFCEFVSKIR